MTRLRTVLQTHPKEVVGVLLVLFLILLALSIWAWNPPTAKATTFAALCNEVLDLQSPSVYPLDTLATPDYPTISDTTIPHIVHRVLFDDNKDQNTAKPTHLATWEHKSFTTRQRHDFVASTFGGAWPDIVSAYNLCRLTEIQICLFKYLVVYHYGGLYLDANAVSLKPLDDLVSSNKALVAPCTPPKHVDLFGTMTQGQGEYQSWWVMAPPKSEFLWQLVWQIVRNIFLLHTQGEGQCKFTQLSSNIADSTADGVCYTYVACKFTAFVTVCHNDFVSLKHNMTTRITNAFVGSPSPQLGDTPVHLVYVQDHKPTALVAAKYNISAIIHQTHESRWVTPAMALAIQKLRDHAPDCHYRFYDAQERRAFIAQHYPSALNAYDTLIPGAYRADLFRAIVVYIHGGMYFDVGITPYPMVKLFPDFVEESDSLVFPIDVWPNGLCAGIFAGSQHHPYLLKIIEQILSNVTNRLYFKEIGIKGAYKVTGPVAFYDALKSELPHILKEGVYTNGLRLLWFSSTDPIMSVSKSGKLLYRPKHSNYQNDHFKINGGVPYYVDLWREGKIYKQMHELVPHTDSVRTYNVFDDALQRIRSLPARKLPSHIPVLYINMDRSVNRRICVEQEMESVSVQATRIRGVDGKVINSAKSVYDGVTVKNDFRMTPSEVGCAASHLIAIRHAYDQKWPYVLICEDDVSFKPLGIWQQPVIDDLFKSIPEDIGMLLLYWGGIPYESRLYISRVTDVKPLFSCCAYIVTHKGMTDILNHAHVSKEYIHLRKKHNMISGAPDHYFFY